ncbi:MAG: glycosyltransferase [Candidatus Methanoperedenaceae archaeon]|nr:glycosyltransferase [Candidatus Methanoperedenaceae archaeon]
MKQILLISYNFPPIKGAETTMTMNYVKSLSKLGWFLIVLTGKSSIRANDPEGLNEISKEVKVFRVRSIEDIALDIFFHIGLVNIQAVNDLSSQRGPIHKANLVKSIVIVILTFLKGMKFVPNHIAGWELFATRMGKRILRENNISAIVSRSTPITSHFIALELKKTSNLPWIACFSDPWTLAPNPPYSHKFLPSRFIKILNEYLERKIISSADKIVFTTKYQKDLYSEKYHDLEDKFVVIPNSFDPNENIECCNKKENKFTIVYTGGLSGERSPEPFLKALVILKKERKKIYTDIRVIFIGNLATFANLIEDYNLCDIIKVKGELHRTEALKYLTIADILLLIDAPNSILSIYLPSKLLDYIRVNKPILAITPKGESSDVIKTTKTGTVISSYDPNDIANSILSYYNDYINGSLEVNPDFDEINKYSAEICTRKLIGIIEPLINSSIGNS